MNLYELVYILPAALPEDKTKELSSKIESFLLDKKGEIIKSDNWGIKKMCYPIKKTMNGNYFFLNFKLEPEHINVLNQNLKLMETVVRFLILKQEIKAEKKKKPKKAHTHYTGRYQRNPYQNQRNPSVQNNNVAPTEEIKKTE